jgi:4'-phosphopantetheinyl transferase
MLTVFDNIKSLGGGFLKHALPLLSEQRREKVLAYRFEQDKILSTAVYLLLRRALLEAYGIDEAVEFAFLENGKPVLRDYPHIHFSLSHCREAVACALSESEAGVDVQHIEPVSDKVAGYVLTPEEYSAYKTAEDPPRRFCELWTIKESFLKKSGRGIGMDLSSLSAAGIEGVSVFSGEGYCGCVAGAVSLSPPRILLQLIGAHEE